MLEINTNTVKKLIAEQFPQWTQLAIYPVAKSGHDNRTFHLGDEMTIRLPSGAAYAPQIEKELTWLPQMAPHLSLPISCPIAAGLPTADYPFPWSVNRFIKGETASRANIANTQQFAADLAMFLKELQAIDTTGAPVAGPHNFHRGGNLSVYHEETEEALTALKTLLPIDRLRILWEKAIRAKSTDKAVWVHGDVAPGNLLTTSGVLCGVIDFGCMGIGDPSCDYVMAWTLFDAGSRRIFFETLGCDRGSVERAKGWALWKALITYRDESADAAANARHTLRAILEEPE